jgi:hypothetical protein
METERMRRQHLFCLVAVLATLLMGVLQRPVIGTNAQGTSAFSASEEGLSIDLYTQKGGKGPDEPSGGFRGDELVHLIALVTYYGNPVEYADTSFVFHPLDGVSPIYHAMTNESGIAEYSFRIPYLPSSAGEWVAEATVLVASILVWDTLHFMVSCTAVVGGYSLQLVRQTTVTPLTPYYLTLLGSMSCVLPILRWKQRKPRD